VPFYRDVYDHFLRITDLVEGYRDLVTSALDAYLSVQSNRMNDIMKTLTLISTVMLPITFIAGVYGMNFKYMPELDAVWGYPSALGAMAAVVVVCLSLFWRKGWMVSGSCSSRAAREVARATNDARGRGAEPCRTRASPVAGVNAGRARPRCREAPGRVCRRR